MSNILMGTEVKFILQLSV